MRNFSHKLQKNYIGKEKDNGIENLFNPLQNIDEDLHRMDGIWLTVESVLFEARQMSILASLC